MANNRLYLCCLNCGETLFLDRSDGEQYYIGEDRRTEINKFLEEHAFCQSGRIADGGDFALMDEFDREDLLVKLHETKAKEHKREYLLTIMHDWNKEEI